VCNTLDLDNGFRIGFGGPAGGSSGGTGAEGTSMRSCTTHTAAVRRSEEEDRIFRTDFAKGSRLAAGSTSGIHTLTYDVARFPFAGEIMRLLTTKGILDPDSSGNLTLERLHEVLPESARRLDVSEINEVSRQLYEQDELFLSIYRDFLQAIIGPLVGGDFVYQCTPTIRFHFPHQRGFDWSPRYHSDIMLGHPPQETNIWLPLTRTFSSNALRLAALPESLELLYSMELDFARFVERVQTDRSFQAACERASRPLELEYGQIAAFDSRCLHATQHNVTDSTRVSMDFRIIPLEEYDSIRLEYRGTGRRMARFTRGQYYASQTAGMPL
jgi:hypothetical protein